jgi:hypothetical protein
MDNRWNSDDPYIRATVRGRAITASLARLVQESDEGRFWVDMRSVLSGGEPRYNAKAGEPSPGTNDLIPDSVGRWQFGSALNHVWHYHTPEFGKDKPYG